MKVGRSDLRRMLRFALAVAGLTAVFAAAALADPKASDLLKRPGFNWVSASTQHLRLHFEPGSLAESKIEDLKRREEAAFARNVSLLGGEYPHRTDIFIVGSRERMEQLIGRQTNGVGYPSTLVACFVFGDKINASGSHELMHVMAGNAWGMKPETWLSEGFATYSDDRWHGYGLHDIGKFLLAERKLIPLDSLLGDFRDSSDMVTYPQSGSFVKFLYERFGVEKTKELWKNGSTKNLKKVTGFGLGQLEKEWHLTLSKADSSKVRYQY